MVSNKNDVPPGGYPNLCRANIKKRPTKTFNDGHSLNAFAEQPNLYARKCSGCQKHCQISEKISENTIL